MKKWVYAYVFCAVLVLYLAQVQAEDARHAAYCMAAQAFVENHILPNGEAIEQDNEEDFSENKLAIVDVDGDGQPELLIRFQTGSIASNQLFVCGFNEETGKLILKFIGMPESTFYRNGSVKENASHNQGLAGDFWPYSISTYNAQKKEYELMGSVDAWSREAYPTNPFENDAPFPQKIDVTGDGFVYFIDDEHFEGARGSDTPVDTPIYKAWVHHYLGQSEPILIRWFPADAQGISGLKAQ